MSTEANNRTLRRLSQPTVERRAEEMFGRVVDHSGRFVTLWQRPAVRTDPPDLDPGGVGEQR